jgi:hypothetical protein
MFNSSTSVTTGVDFFLPHFTIPYPILPIPFLFLPQPNSYTQKTHIILSLGV